MRGGADEDESSSSSSSVAAPRASLKTRNNYSNWKHKLRENCCRRIRDDRNRLLWKMRTSLPNNNNNHSSSSFTHQESTFIQSALQGIVSDELTKLNHDLLWEYDGLHSQPECEDILLEMQNIFYQDLVLHQTTQQTSWEDDEDDYLARAVYQHMQLTEATVTLELIRNRLAEAHAEHLDRGCKLTPKIRMESRFNLSVLYIECSSCDTFEVLQNLYSKLNSGKTNIHLQSHNLQIQAPNTLWKRSL
ncbi:uncharacterized protein LOC141697584 isoform X2 [Apium graveolens]|uniref:uncharacterized protein LOC141697584 isoform X2 n=1 Tax=Apium graveolens TaxID=4045 RepID=UPI003D798F94